MNALHARNVLHRDRGALASAAVVVLDVALGAAAHAGAQTYKAAVAGFFSDNIIRYNLDTAFPYDHMVGKGLVPTLDNPVRMTLGDGDALYVTNHNGDSVLQFDSQTGAYEGVFIRIFDQAAPPSFDPWWMRVGPDGLLYVASGITDSVLRYDLVSGAYLGPFVAPSSGGLDNAIDVIFIPDPPAPCAGDLNGDGMVDGADLGLVLGAWGTCRL